ncbi:hypothetical protein M231_07100 [Tremella mesenterica]|uniref:Uncharacterized protein n=1 Tax=Tremella mesenterica TaxID=5217 RepID=A0A4V1M348_TREME|nr:hypothetical protein M231_07100 [Tremella mesenterica]
MITADEGEGSSVQQCNTHRALLSTTKPDITANIRPGHLSGQYLTPLESSSATKEQQAQRYGLAPNPVSLPDPHIEDTGEVQRVPPLSKETPTPPNELPSKQNTDWNALPRFKLTDDWSIPWYPPLFSLSLEVSSASGTASLTFGTASNRVNLTRHSGVMNFAQSSSMVLLQTEAQEIIHHHLIISADSSWKEGTGYETDNLIEDVISTVHALVLDSAQKNTELSCWTLHVLLFKLAGTGHHQNISLRSRMTELARRWLNIPPEATHPPVEAAPVASSSEAVTSHVWPLSRSGSTMKKDTKTPRKRSCPFPERPFTVDDPPPALDPSQPFVVVDESGWTVRSDPALKAMTFHSGTSLKSGVTSLTFGTPHHQVVFKASVGTTSVKKAMQMCSNWLEHVNCTNSKTVALICYNTANRLLGVQQKEMVKHTVERMGFLLACQPQITMVTLKTRLTPEGQELVGQQDTWELRLNHCLYPKDVDMSEQSA